MKQNVSLMSLRKIACVFHYYHSAGLTQNCAANTTVSVRTLMTPNHEETPALLIVSPHFPLNKS